MRFLLQPASACALAGALLFSGALAQQHAIPPRAQGIAAVRQGFLSPPPEARPMVRWWWFGPAVVKPEILRELQQMKADGIGGAELAFVYPEVLDDPAKSLKNLPFLSPEMLGAVRYAQMEGRRLGLRIDVTLCSGWPYGGPSITLDEAVTRLRTVEVPIAVGQQYPWEFPKLEPGESPIAMAVVRGVPKHWDASTAFMPSNLATGVDAGPYEEPHVALYFIQSHTKQQVKRAAVDAEGYVLDPFSHEAVAKHLKNVGEPLLSAFGSTPPYAIFSDSLEAYGADWTPDLPAEFLKRRGYDLLEHLPELVAGGSPAADKVRHDYGRTLTELIDENYLTQINQWALAHHTKFRSQTYGDPAVSFSSQNLAGLAEGEGPQWRAFSTLRWASSANHVFGNNVTSGESFTWLHSPVFRATPLDMKAEADIDFIMGENQLIFHGWPYSPPDHEVPEPGWSLYAAAALNDHNPWHPVMPAVTQYIARLSWLLRQGKPANQVAILLPTDDAWASFSPGHTSVTDAMKTLIAPELMSTILSAGYNVDFIDADAINKVGLGTHQILVLPPTNRIPVETIRRIHEWAAHGGKVFALGHLPLLDTQGKNSPEIDHLSEAIAVVPDSVALAKAMQSVVVPDFQLKDADDATKSAIGFIRRKLPDGDIYFITNTSNQTIKATVHLETQFAGGEILDPDTGESIKQFANNEVKLNLAPYDSETLLFDSEAKAPKPPKWGYGGYSGSIEDWTVTFTNKPKFISVKGPYDWTKDPSTLHYSGEAVYSRNLELRSIFKDRGTRLYLQVGGGSAISGAPNSAPEHGPAPGILGPDGLPNPLITRPGPGMHAWFDPPVHEAALVYINGKAAGSFWHPPYRLDVTKLLHAGRNHIEIHVYNTALNAWSALPPRDYKPLIDKYGDRFQMQDLNKVMPLPSGITGWISLESEYPIQ